MLLIWSTVTAYYDIADVSLLEERTRRLASRAAATTALEYVSATVRLQRAARRIGEFWRNHDFVLSPVTPMAFVPNGVPEREIDDLARHITCFTRWANLTGQPAAAMPVAQTSDGTPLAVHLIAGPGQEATLIRLCGQIETLVEGGVGIAHDPV